MKRPMIAGTITALAGAALMPLMPAGAAHAAELHPGPRHVNPAGYASTCGSGYRYRGQSDGAGVSVLLFSRGHRFCSVAANTSGTREYMLLRMFNRNGGVVSSDAGWYSRFAGPVYATVPTGQTWLAQGLVNFTGPSHGQTGGASVSYRP